MCRKSNPQIGRLRRPFPPQAEWLGGPDAQRLASPPGASRAPINFLDLHVPAARVDVRRDAPDTPMSPSGVNARQGRSKSYKVLWQTLSVRRQSKFNPISERRK